MRAKDAGFYRQPCLAAAVDKALADGYRTPDLWKEGFQKANTEEITKVICERI